MRTALIIVVQILAGACAIVMSLWGSVPWPGVAALGVLSAALAAASMRRAAGKPAWIAACLCTLVAGAALLPGKDLFFLDAYYGALAWLIAVEVLAVSFFGNDRFRNYWRALGLGWAFFGAFIWTAHTYLQDLRIAFYPGVLVDVGLLILLKRWFRLPAAAILAANTLILLLVALPAADLLIQPRLRSGAFDPAKKYYRYDVGSRDPRGYGEWTLYVSGEWNHLWKQFCISDPAGKLPPTLRPNTRGRFFSSPMSVNSLGFRGPEIPRDKGDAYRIVALGESTTFGVTHNPEDKPWPELLEQMIRERLKPCRPVEVVNAGLPGYTLRYNLGRLPKDILPLKPDMILSYHGFNGFPSILAALPEINVKHAPQYHRRAVKLLADLEFKLKVNRFHRQQLAKLAGKKITFPDPMTTDYAAAYRELVETTGTNGIRLVLGNFSMAVNSGSDPQVIDFYRGTFHAVHWQIKANEVHSTIVKRTAEQHPEVCFVDMHPHLDGEHDKFTDLVHLTEEGRQQVAESFFAGIKAILEREVAQPGAQPAGPPGKP